MTRNEARNLKAGDMLLCTETCGSVVTKGEFYIVGGKYDTPDARACYNICFGLEETDAGRPDGFPVSWLPFFELGGGPW